MYGETWFVYMMTVGTGAYLERIDRARDCYFAFVARFAGMAPSEERARARYEEVHEYL